MNDPLLPIRLLRSAALPLLVAVAVSFAYATLWPQAPVQQGDSAQYLEVAQDLDDYRLDALHIRTPGYPLLLALTGSAWQPTRALFMVSVLFHLGTVALLGAVLRTVAVPLRWVVVFAGVLLLPPYVEPAAHVMTENLAQFALAAGFWALACGLIRRRTGLVMLAAVAFACSSLVRPVFQLLPFALAGCVLAMAWALGRQSGVMRRRAAVAAVLLTGISLLLLGGLASLNHRKFGHFVITAGAGFHFSTKTMAFLERLPDEYADVREILIRERDIQLTKRGGPHTGTQAVWSVRQQLSEATGLSTPELSNYLVGMNLTLIRRAPLEYLQEVARSMATYWLPVAGPLASLGSTVLRWLWAIVHVALVAAFFLQLVVLTGILVFERTRPRHARGRSLIRATRAQTAAFGLAAVIVLYTMLLSCTIDIGEPRQRLSTEALYVFMVWLGAWVWRQSALDARPRQQKCPRRSQGSMAGPA